MIGDEGFKAASEIAKTTGKAIDAGEKGAHYLAETFADAINALAGAAADSAKGFRIRNRASVAIKTQRHLHALGLDTSYLGIEDRAAVPLIAAVSVESDDGLQEMWASYIANAVDPRHKTIGITRIITDAISKLEPEDKGVLDRLFRLDLAELRNDSVRLSPADFQISDEALNYSLTRFVALGLFSCDNSGSVGFAASEGHNMPCNIEIYTSIGWFRALPLLLMFKQSLMQV
ncbi:DUF4393 domain-containing protein [Mesorhizobium sp. BR1-1-9]|uniref:DUF4393 domain-containing protein n=1 Tax=Mesorhizobium sp. BR1-1-9 TaxID=2876646 RepID=UPI001CD0BC47|nr:DUF4393 domain-containing protein [Mesorhizobium sp. BR1-1-9]MBZ9870506.1 DUF4393 domain-containing protein [Mesorhizobium sp. BR1-1-9]